MNKGKRQCQQYHRADKPKVSYEADKNHLSIGPTVKRQRLKLKTIRHEKFQINELTEHKNDTHGLSGSVQDHGAHISNCCGLQENENMNKFRASQTQNSYSARQTNSERFEKTMSETSQAIH